MRNGTLKPVVSQVLSLEQAPLAHERVVAPGSTLLGKIILRPKL